MNILIVDDNLENRYLLEALLKGNGHQVEAFANGSEALARLKKGGVDLVVSDILMPVMDGFELCRQVRAEASLADLPFLVYTGTYTSKQDEELALRVGADRFLLKPCEPEALLAAVREFSDPNKVPSVRSAAPEEAENEVLKLYNERLVKKLEQKMVALENEIVARRSTEAQLIQTRKMESLGRLAGGVAHDFNNMLNFILGLTELILARPNFQDTTREEIQEIHRAAEKATDLTHHLLAFSRKQVLSPVALELNDAVRSAETLIRRILGSDIRLELNLAPEPLRVLFDPVQVDQILVNLATNARDAMPRGGLLTITSGKVITPTGGIEIRLSVHDTGCGMEPEILEHIFEPFFTTKASGAGTGFGLATLYGVVTQHQGRVEVQSRPGQGTDIRIYLPRLDEVTPPL